MAAIMIIYMKPKHRITVLVNSISTTLPEPAARESISAKIPKANASLATQPVGTMTPHLMIKTVAVAMM